MSGGSPSIQGWRDLYGAAMEFKKIACWNWMWDSDVFGVQDPVSGEVGYCCIMGRAGEHFALAVFLGSEGLEGYLKIRSEETSLFPMDVILLQKCLMASFEDRRFLQKRDLQVIKTLGLKFRGRKSWPLFRSYLPGYHPWYLNSEEAKYLTVALRQAINVSLRFKDNPELFTPLMENQYLVRVSEKEKVGLRWRDKWLKPLPLKKEIPIEPVDADRVEYIERMNLLHRGIWEVDFFFFPEAVQDGEERPYHPYVILLVDHDSGLILNCHLAKPNEYVSDFPKQFLRSIEGIGTMPREILVKKEEVAKLLEPTASRLRIKLRNVKRLTALEEALDGMLDLL